MILTGNQIESEVAAGRIRIEPFDTNKLSTNSYDLRLGNTFVRYTSEVLDPRTEPKFETLTIPPNGMTLRAGDFILASTEERIGSDFFVPIIHAKSGTARLGLFVHVTADLIDLGFFGNSTLQLFATLPVTIYPGQLIAQVTFWKPVGRIELYRGKYQGSRGPQSSKSYKDVVPD